MNLSGTIQTLGIAWDPYKANRDQVRQALACLIDLRGQELNDVLLAVWLKGEFTRKAPSESETITIEPLVPGGPVRVDALYWSYLTSKETVREALRAFTGRDGDKLEKCLSRAFLHGQYINYTP